MPAFGTISVRGMLDDMKDICGQLLLKVSLLVCRLPRRLKCLHV